MGLTLDLIREAAGCLEPHIRRTPVEYSPGLSEVLGTPVWLKLESMQITGSFKIRGAWFRLSRLSEEERRAGVLTCSAGNHGKAVAHAAQALGVRAVICVPASVDEAKYQGMLALGAEVRKSEFAGYDETEEWARASARREGLPFLSPFDDVEIMAANGGTLAMEVLEQAPDAASFVLPVGGGGLAGGFAFVVKERNPRAAITGCQHERSPALKMSLERGEAVTTLPAVETAAGGLEGGIGRLPFEVLRTRVDNVALLSEEEILEGVRWMIDRHQYLIEPSAAAGVAACLTGKTGPVKGPAVVVVSGRNVSCSTIRRILG